MNNLIKIISKSGKCLCVDCRLFQDTSDTFCPISQNKENISFMGEPMDKWPQDYAYECTWCRFQYSGMEAGEQDKIWNNHGYKVQGPNGKHMWIPSSIVEPVTIRLEKEIPEIKRRSKLARIAIR